MDDELEVGSGGETQVDTGNSADDGLEFDLDDFGSDEQDPQATVPQQPSPPRRPGQGATAPAVTRSAEQISAERIERLERQNRELTDRFSPLLQQHYQQMREQSEKPPFTLEQLQNGTVENLLQYMQWAVDRGVGRVHGTIAQETTRAAAETSARQLFTPAKMGEGNDYSTVVSKYADPYIRDFPHVGMALQSMPNPAHAKYILGAMLRFEEQHGEDPVPAMNAFLNAGKVYQNAQSDAVGKIRAARRISDTVLPANAGPKNGPKKVTSELIDGMSDEAFDRMDRQIEQRRNRRR